MTSRGPSPEMEVALQWAPSSSVPGDDGWLTVGERKVLATLRFPKRIGDWLLGRWVAKGGVLRLLAGTDLSAAQVEILPEEGGAPTCRFIAEGTWPPIAVSLSHSHGVGFACAARGTGPVGCDVELVTDRSASFIRDYLTAAERAWVESGDHVDRRATLVWSAKESALKALGEGLRLDTRQVEVSVAGWDAGGDGGWSPLSVRAPGGVVFEGWWCGSGMFLWTVVSHGGLTRPPDLPPVFVPAPAPGAGAPD